MTNAQATCAADKILSDDAYVLPLYQKPTFVAVQNSVANVRNNSSLDSPTYNAARTRGCGICGWM